MKKFKLNMTADEFANLSEALSVLCVLICLAIAGTAVCLSVIWGLISAIAGLV